MEILDFKNTYWNYYLQMEKDLFESAPYCAIDIGNNNAFSTRYLQLHLSICSEIDTISKTFCKELDVELDVSHCGIEDYMRILHCNYPTFGKEEVKLIGSKYRVVKPWKNIDSGYSPNWWQIYNDIKHHRDVEKGSKPNYKHATQKNVILALSALYVLIEYWAAKCILQDNCEKKTKKMIALKSDNLSLLNWDAFYTFSLYANNLWFDCEKYFKYIEQGKLVK